nr:hypothetical protein SAML2017_21020 [Salmonella enterica]
MSYTRACPFSFTNRKVTLGFEGLCPTLGAVGGENIPTVAADVVDESAKTLIGTAARSRL